MCQTVQVSDEGFVTAFRKMYDGRRPPDTIEAYGSFDGCRSWRRLSTVKVMPEHSNPPALVRLHDGRLCCAYGDRAAAEIRARYSDDNGWTWGQEIVVRDDFQGLPGDPDLGISADMGYVRMVQRPDGKLVCDVLLGDCSASPAAHRGVDLESMRSTNQHRARDLFVMSSYRKVGLMLPQGSARGLAASLVCLLVLEVLAVTPPPRAVAEDQQIETTTVFQLEEGNESRTGYRIPALAVTNAGTLLAFSERRVGLHDHAENDIVSPQQ